jgi:hypothetical protein
VPELEEIRESVKETVKDAAQQISDATKDAVQQLVHQSLLQLVEAAKTMAEQALTGARRAGEHAAEAGHSAAGAAHHSVESNSKTAADTAESVKPQARELSSDEQEAKGGFLRYLVVGMIIGGLIAYFSQRAGSNDDEDFGEENWIEVKHDEAGTGPAMPESAKPAASAPKAAAAPQEAEVPPTQEELEARASDH